MRTFLLFCVAVLAASTSHAQVLGAPVVTWDFAAGIPASFENGSATPLAQWEYRGPDTTPNNTVCSRGSCGAGTLPIASVTTANGFVIFDSNYWDDNDTQCGGFGTGPDPAPHNAWLTTSPINLTGVTGAVLTFQQQLRAYQCTTKVQLSTDGGANFTDIFTNTVLNTPTAEWRTISLAGLADNAADVRIRFVFIGSYYHWCLDDITVYIPSTNDVMLDKATYTQFGDAGLGPLADMEYDQYPSHMLAPFKFRARTTNIGALAQTGVQASVKVLNASNVITQTWLTNTATIAPGATSTLSVSGTWTPPATLGDFRIVYEVDQTQADETPLNNIDTLDYTISTYAFARDEGPMENVFVPQAAYTGQRLEIGNMFEGQANNRFLHSISVAVGTGTMPGTVIQGKVYDIGIDSVFAVTVPYTVNLADINSTGEEILITLPLEDPLLLYNDSIYCVMVGNLDGAQPLRVCRSGPSPAQTSFVIYPDAPAAFYLLTTPVVRMNIFQAGAIPGCTDPAAINYLPGATINDGSCDFAGCTIEGADNYNPSANWDDGSCLYAGCTDPEADNYDPFATSDDGSCIFTGCTDPDASNYDPQANQDDGSCLFPGCTDPAAANYDPQANWDDSSCLYPGCTDPEADNYDPGANEDDGSCIYYGCTNPNAENYDPTANTDDGSCIVLGCLDPEADNYNAEANTDDGSCFYLGCMDPEADNYDATATVDDGSCIYFGCTDPDANNYDPGANTNDGSCTYNTAMLSANVMSGCVPLAVLVTNQTTIADEAYCSFAVSNGTMIEGCSPTLDLLFDEPGEYYVTYTYQQGESVSEYILGPITVNANPETPVLSLIDGSVVCANCGPDAFTWTIDGEEIADASAATVTTFIDGTYQNGNYVLSAMNDAQCTAVSEPLFVFRSYFTLDTNEGCEPLTVTMTDLTDPVDGMSCALTLDGEAYPLEDVTTFNFPDDGYFLIQLECGANGSTSTVVELVSVFPVIIPELNVDFDNGTVFCQNCDGHSTLWYEDGTLIAEDVNQVDIQGWEYTVLLTTVNGCEGEETIWAWSVNELPLTSIALYPNPASQTLTVSSDWPSGMVEIYDGQGRKIVTRSFNQRTFTLPVEELASGIYTITLKNKNGLSTARFIVQH